MPSRRTLLAAVGALAAFGLVLALWPRGETTPEDELRALVAECVEAANRKDPSGITVHLAEDFRGQQGARKQDVKQVLVVQLLRGDQVAVLNPRLDVTVESPTRGAIDGTFVFARVPAKTAEELPQGSVAAIYRIEAKLERRDEGWTFVEASYRRVDAW